MYLRHGNSRKSGADLSDYYGNNLTEEIKERCNIVDVIGSVVPLKKAGSNYKGLCPFHNEKTPSFVVSPSKQIFTCFGCGESGNVIKFVMKYYNLEFIPAVEKLAVQYNIDLSKYQTGSRKNREEYYRINRDAAAFFFKTLRKQNNPGLIYMTKRGLNADTLNKFGIGYADEKWDSLFRYMTGLGHDKKKLIELGLISESKGKYFDKFRNRVIFPIINTSGKVIGFGGRVLDDGMPKYLNSPETPVFSKKSNLYALNLTRKEIEKQSRAILVEGYMDVISLYQNEVYNVSASLGTALTENQIRLLKRYIAGGEIIISYDSDQAGKNAALRALDLINEAGCTAKVLNIAHGKDPDEYIRQYGKNSFLELVDSSVPFAKYKLGLLYEKYDINDMQQRVKFLKESVKVLKQLTPIEADMYIKILSDETSVSEGAIRSEFEGRTDISVDRIFKKEDDKAEESSMTPLEKNIIKLLINDSTLFKGLREFKDLFTNRTLLSLYSEIEKQYTVNNEADIQKVLDALDENERTEIDSINRSVHFAGKEDEVYHDCIKTIRNTLLKEKEEFLLAKLSMADEAENPDNITEIMNTLKKIQKLKV